MKVTQQSLNNKAAIDKFIIEEKDYQIKCGLSRQELDAIYALRAKVFCQELNWVGNPTDVREIDKFDTHVNHIAVFIHGKPVGTIRTHQYNQDWMLFTVFEDLIKNNVKPKKLLNTCEVSRLAVDLNYRSFFDGRGIKIAKAIYQGVFVYCQLNNFRFLHMVVTIPMLRLLRQSGYPCVEYSDRVIVDARGTVAVAAQLDWVMFISQMSKYDPHNLNDHFRALANASILESDDNANARVA